MPSNWIGRILLTDQTELTIGENKVHDLIPCNQGAGVVVDKGLHPVLWEKLGGGTGDEHWDSTKLLIYCNGGNGSDLIYGKSDVGYFGGVTRYDDPVAGLHVKPGDYVKDNSIGSASLLRTREACINLDSSTGSTGTWQQDLKGVITDVSDLNKSYSDFPTDGSLFLRNSNKHLVLSLGSIKGVGAYDLGPRPSGWNVHTLCRHADDTLSYYLNGEWVVNIPRTPLEGANLSPKGPVQIAGTNMGYSKNTLVKWIRNTTVARYVAGEDFLVQDKYNPFETTPSVIPEVPDMVAPTGSPHPYRIIADKT